MTGRLLFLFFVAGVWYNKNETQQVLAVMIMEESKFLIITGMSGAGKTQAIRTLEDMNYFCVDNMPPALITKFAELSRQASAPRNTAIVVDIRGGRFLTNWQKF